MGKLTESTYFKLAACEVFAKIDEDNNGHIDKDELTVALCHLHFRLKSKAPGVTEPPTKEKVRQVMEQYDYDLSGTLTVDEFLDFACRWFENNGGAFLQRVVLTSFIGMVVLPESANLIHSHLPFKRFMPRIMFKVLFGVAFKLIATSLPLRRFNENS